MSKKKGAGDLKEGAGVLKEGAGAMKEGAGTMKEGEQRMNSTASTILLFFYQPHFYIGRIYTHAFKIDF